MSDDKSKSAKRRLRRKVASARRKKSRAGDNDWHPDAKVAVLTRSGKKTHAAAVLDACLKLKKQGIKNPRTLLAFNTPGGNTLTFIG